MRHLLLTLIFLALARVVPADPPNIIFIMADDLGWGELGCYGNTFNETPCLNELAGQGIRFTQAYAAAPVCSPTRASLLTGQYPARVRITDFLPGRTRRYLDPARFKTISELLSAAGYHTGIIGKWHLDTDFKNNPGGPDKHGFEEVIGTETKYIAGGDYFFPYDKISTFTTGEENEFLTDRLSQEACGFIERHKDRPFFLYLSHYSVHTRLDAPEEVVNKYKRKFDARYGAGEAEKLFGNKRHEADHPDNPYLAAMLEHMDASVGKIMETLKAQGLEDNTLLVFFSDNGGANKVGDNGPLRAGKTWLYEGGIREPLLIRWPGKITRGQVSDLPVSSVDFFPTFAEAAGAETPEEVDGISLVPYLTENKRPDRDVLFWHYPSETGNWENRMAGAVRKGDFKLLEFYADGRLELYDLARDPGEKKDLTGSRPGKTGELKKILDAWKREVNAEEPVIGSQ